MQLSCDRYKTWRALKQNGQEEKKKINDDGDQEMTRNGIETALKECLLRLGYEALKTEQESAIVPLVEGNHVFICLHTGFAVTFAIQPV